MTTSGGATPRSTLWRAPIKECQVSGPGIMMRTMTMIQIKWKKEDQLFLQQRNLAACSDIDVRCGAEEQNDEVVKLRQSTHFVIVILQQNVSK